MATSARLYRNGRCADDAFDPAKISDVIDDDGVLVWLDIEGPTQESMDMLRDEFGFHELALEDCLHPHQRPKIEQYDSYFFVVMYGSTTKDDEVVEHEMAAFVSRKFLVTVRKEPAWNLSGVMTRWDAHEGLTKEGGGYLLYILLDEVVDGYFSVLDTYEDRVEVVESRILAGKEPPDASELLTVKKEIVRFRRAISPLREVLDALQRRTVDVVSEPLEPYYRDVYDHVLRVTDFTDSLRDALATALEVHLSIVSNRMNAIMKSLTSWGAIILVPTLIAGIYGMNFRHMPELLWRYGYAWALVVMAGAAFALYVAFKRKDWL